MASKEPLKQQVPRETLPHVSQSVISSSNINQVRTIMFFIYWIQLICVQGDLVDTVSSSSSTNAPTAPKASATALKSPSPEMAQSIPNPTTIYASISDINCSSNAKTYVGGSISTKIAIIAGNTKSIEIDVDEQDCAPYNNYSRNAIHPMSLKKINNQLVEQCDGSKPVNNTQSFNPRWIDAVDGPASNKG